MPRIAEMREIDGQLWVRVETTEEDGQVTLWTSAEIKEHANCAVRDFLLNLYDDWKDRL